MSAADFLLSPEVQKLLQVLYAEPAKPLSAHALSKKTRLSVPDVIATLEHLTNNDILTLHGAGEDEIGAFSVNTAFIFHAELRRMALKSFAAAEPIRRMLIGKFKMSVVRAFVLGEADDGSVELLVVHGELVPGQPEMSAACRRLSASIGRHLNVHVIPHDRYASLTPRDALGAKLVLPAAFEIIGQGDTKAKLRNGREGLIEVARRRLAALAR